MSDKEAQVKLYLVKHGATHRVLRVVLNGNRLGGYVKKDMAAEVLQAANLNLAPPMMLMNITVGDKTVDFKDAQHIKDGVLRFPVLANADCVDGTVGAAGLWPKVFFINNGGEGYLQSKNGAYRALTERELDVLKAQFVSGNLDLIPTAQSFGGRTIIADCCSRVENPFGFLPGLVHEADVPGEVKYRVVQLPHVQSDRTGLGTVEQVVATPRAAFIERNLSVEQVAALEADATNFQEFSAIRAKHRPIK